MKNVFDIRYEKNLTYIIPEESDGYRHNIDKEIHNKTAIIMYLYYIDTVADYFKYMDRIPCDIDVYIISSLTEVLESVRGHIDKPQWTYILKENRGRDISALLVTSRDILKKYEYVCFVHDKKEHDAEMKNEVQLWIKNLWGNLVGNEYHIEKILEIFKANPELGILAPPDPIGDHFSAWIGQGWSDSFGVAKKLVEILDLKTDLNYKKPPLTLGTALWFRTNAIRGLYKVHWDYSDFDDEKLGVSGNYLSYGIERIFPYVAQDAGYDTGEVMTLEYAQLQNSYLHYSVPRLINYASMYYNIPTTIADLEIKQKQVDRLLKFSNRYESVFLYGAGKRGQYCLRLLRKNGIEKEKAFIVSYRPNNEIVEGLRVISVNSVNKCEVLSSGIIITVADKDAQKDIIRNLGELGITNYMIF